MREAVAALRADGLAVTRRSSEARCVAQVAQVRRAMRDHLTRSLERYRKLAEGSTS